MTLFTTKFWADTAERSIKTLAQSLLALTVVGEGVFNILTVNWQQALGVAVGAGVISILTSIVSATLTSSDSASLAVKTVSKE
jgi:hypothetical protein